MTKEAVMKVVNDILSENNMSLQINQTIGIIDNPITDNVEEEKVEVTEEEVKE